MLDKIPTKAAAAKKRLVGWAEVPSNKRVIWRFVLFE